MPERIPLSMPALAGPTDAEVAAAEAILDRRESALAERARRSTVACTSQVATGKGCGARHEIGDLTYVQTHWYEEAHGCTGGDRWHMGEGQWRCPSCGHVNRLYDSPDVVALKPHFKVVEDRHDD